MLTSLLHVSQLAGLTATWLLAGYALLPRRLRADEPFLIASTAFALGAGLTAVAVTLAAALGVMTRATLWAIQIAVVLLAARGASNWRRQQLPALMAFHSSLRTSLRTSLRRWPTRLVLAALLLMALATLLATLAPPSSMDATVYHLAVPRAFLRAGRWVALTGIVQSYQPLYVEMLFAHAMGIGDDVLAALVHWALGIAAVTTAGAWSRRLGGSAGLGMLIAGASAIFVWESTSAFVDLGVATFASLALLWATRAEIGAASWLLAGVFAGLAAGSKLTGAFAGVMTAGVSLCATGPDWRAAQRRFLAIGALAFVLALPWYMRNLLLIGNPFYPVGNTLLGQPPAMLASGYYGTGHGVWALLRSPFEVLFAGDAFDKGWSLGPAYLALLPLGIWRTARTKAGRLAVGTLLGWWLLWFFSSPQTRLLLPVTPIAAALAAVGAGWALTATARSVRWAAAVTLGLAAAVGLAVALVTAVVNAPAAIGRQSAATFLRRTSWHYVAFENANRLLPADARVAVVGLTANNLYYLDRPASFFESRPSLATMRAMNLSHVLDIDDCPLPKADDAGATLWSGAYPLVHSRLRGGAERVQCARLRTVAPDPDTRAIASTNAGL